MPGTKRAKLAEWIDQHKPSIIGQKEFERLAEHLQPISETYLRKLLRDSGVQLAPMVEGVRQSNLGVLELSLLALLAEYESGDAGHRQAVRKLVITAKEHAKWTGRHEHVLWLRTWLENPPLFPAWARLRKENNGDDTHASGPSGESQPEG
jgi:hypothetical protein